MSHEKPTLIEHDVTIGALILISQVMGQPDWTADLGEKYVAGDILENVLTEVTSGERPKDQVSFDKWTEQHRTIKLTPRQVVVCVKCIKGKVAAFPAGKHFNFLVRAFELVPDTI